MWNCFLISGMKTPIFFRVFTDLDSVSVHKYAKKEQYSAYLTEQAWSIKDLLHGIKKKISCGTQRVIPSGQDSAFLPARFANLQHKFILANHAISHIIIAFFKSLEVLIAFQVQVLTPLSRRLRILFLFPPNQYLTRFLK